MVGTGPGGNEHLTEAARQAIAAADTVVGYQAYLDLIPELIVGKEVASSAMMQEVARCRLALDLAEQGRRVALVCGGDPGIYALAGLVLELAAARESPAEIKVVPGLAALNSCAALLGAPLMHDFAAISLSDLLTPWPLIERRLSAAAQADFVIVIYNPKSKRRVEQLGRARELILAHRPDSTPVGVVTAATRGDEAITITNLGQLPEVEVGMRSTVIVGNSKTFRWRDFLVTPRGYADKYHLG